MIGWRSTTSPWSWRTRPVRSPTKTVPSGHHVIDVGCSARATSVRRNRAVAPDAFPVVDGDGAAVVVDRSSPPLEHALVTSAAIRTKTKTRRLTAGASG
jgi:hypothetical protein